MLKNSFIYAHKTTANLTLTDMHFKNMKVSTANLPLKQSLILLHNYKIYYNHKITMAEFKFNNIFSEMEDISRCLETEHLETVSFILLPHLNVSYKYCILSNFN